MSRVDVALALVVSGLAACGAPHGETLEWEHPAGLAVDYLLAGRVEGPYYRLHPTLRGGDSGAVPTLRAPLPDALKDAPALFLKACVRRPAGIVVQPAAVSCSPPGRVDRRP